MMGSTVDCWVGRVVALGVVDGLLVDVMVNTGGCVGGETDALLGAFVGDEDGQ
jgi:hypothetical protein